MVFFLAPTAAGTALGALFEIFQKLGLRKGGVEQEGEIVFGMVLGRGEGEFGGIHENGKEDI